MVLSYIVAPQHYCNCFIGSRRYPRGILLFFIFFLQMQLSKFSEVANDVDAIGLAPLAKFDSVCDTVQGEDEYAEVYD